MSDSRKATVISAITHQSSSVCPYTFAWDDDRSAEQRDAHYGSNAWRTQFRNYIQSVPTTDDGRWGQGPPVVTDVYGCMWRRDRRPIHLEQSPIREPSLRGYRFPDPDRLFPAGWEQRANDTIAEYSDCFVVAGIGFGVFERAWSLRGFEDLLTDAAAEPAFFADLIAAVAEHQERLVDRLLSLPVDGIMFSDDWGDQQGVIVGPERWREAIKPHTAKLYAKGKSSGKYVLAHCCGSIVDIIPDVIEIGLDVLESVQPEARGMNPYKLKDR